MPSPRVIPAIEELRRRAAHDGLTAQYGDEAVVEALRAEAAELRQRLAGTSSSDLGPLPDTSDDAARLVVTRAAARLAGQFAPSLRRVINATGVIVHTNLGRAPLGDSVVRHVAAVVRGYSTLEYDLEAGVRGRRDVHAEALLTRLTGAQAAVVVNNNAAATMLMLTALARGREVVISRGELVEIGGGFRVPDIMTQSGAVLREVGTTNRTRVADYAAAISDKTALILRVHPSNFRIEGFTERPGLADLVALGRRHGIPLAEDLGSGHLGGTFDGGVAALREEPAARDSIAAGVDILCFSGDKLLGGPQAGVLLGRRDLLAAVRRHPLMRALRVDKLTYAALEATLLAWLSGRAPHDLPVARMMHLSRDQVRTRAEQVATRLRDVAGLRVSLADGASTIGGGSAPGSQLPTCLLVLEHDRHSADDLESRLRRLPTPIIARIEDDRVVLDLRTVREDEDDEVAEGVARSGGLD